MLVFKECYLGNEVLGLQILVSKLLLQVFNLLNQICEGKWVISIKIFNFKFFFQLNKFCLNLVFFSC